MASAKAEVVIVGGGPVGLGLALELGQRGIKCVMIERRREMHKIPKGQNLTQRTLEHFQFWGLVDEVRKARIMPRDYPIGDVCAYRDLTTPWWYASPDREVVRDFYSQANDRMPQYVIEAIMRRAVERNPNIEVIYDWTASCIEQDAAGVQVTIEGPGAEGRRTIHGDYCVGCDGGRSVVRESLGIRRAGTDFQTKMALVVFRSRALHERLKRFPERSTYTVLKPELNGYWQFFGRIDVGESWFFHAPVPMDADMDYGFDELLYQAAGFRFDCAIDGVTFWDLRVSVAEKYRAGRVFIAGDACHTHPPYGGFGVNNGFEDAVNLGWKLAAVVSGWGGEGLLQSYSQERQPVFVETGEDFIVDRIRMGNAFLQRYSPDRDLKEFEAAWAGRAQDNGARALEYEPNYEGSPVVAGPNGGKSSAHGKHMYRARAGHHLAPQATADGRSNFDLLGDGFTLLCFGENQASSGRFADVAKQLGVPLKVIADGSPAARDAYEADLILVRPDQYVVWASTEAPDDILALWRKVTGR